jgi:hypothetical protein
MTLHVRSSARRHFRTQMPGTLTGGLLLIKTLT